jgi:hypothetical protein
VFFRRFGLSHLSDDNGIMESFGNKVFVFLPRRWEYFNILIFKLTTLDDQIL